MSNRINPTGATEKIESGLRHDTELCKALGESMVKLSSQLGVQVSGQSTIEGDGVRLIVLYSAFPNGNMFIWFLDKGYYRLISLVNKKFREVMTFSADRMDEFQEALTKLATRLGK